MIYIIGIALYLVFLIGIGVVKSRAVRTQDDFMVASRSVSALFLASTLICTSVGSGILFGGAGRAFRDGFSAMWMNLGGWAGMLGVYFLAHRVQRIAQYTAPDILEMRYTATARLLGTGAVVMAYLTIASYQFRGGGRLLHVLTGLDPVYGQVITCILAALYTGLAGMLSIVALDIFNGVLIAGSALVAVPFVLKAAGGWSSMTAILPESHFYSFGSLGLLSALGLFFPLFLQIVGDSGMYQKLMSATDPNAARRGVLGMLVGVIPIQSALAIIGVTGAAIYWSDPAFLGSDASFDAAATETIVLQVARFDLPGSRSSLCRRRHHLFDRQHDADDPVDQPGTGCLSAFREPECEPAADRPGAEADHRRARRHLLLDRIFLRQHPGHGPLRLYDGGCCGHPGTPGGFPLAASHGPWGDSLRRSGYGGNDGLRGTQCIGGHEPGL